MNLQLKANYSTSCCIYFPSLRFYSTTDMFFIFKTETHPDLIPFSFGIVDRCSKHEKILKLLASRSIEEISQLVDLSVLYEMMGPQSPIVDLPQQPFASSISCFHDDHQLLPSLLYPSSELYFNEPCLDLLGDLSNCPEKAYYPDGSVQCNCSGTETNDMLSVISDFYTSKSTNKSSKQTMLVPYFERY